MKESMKMVLLTMVLLGMYFSAIGLATASERSVSIDPVTPVVGSAVTFTTEIQGVNICAYIIVEECTNEICYPGQNVSMPRINDDTYEAPLVQLLHDDAVYIQYHLEVEIDGVWETSEMTKVFLLEKPDNGDQTNGESSNGDDENGTPGFEVIPVLISVIIGAILFRRKRLR